VKRAKCILDGFILIFIVLFSYWILRRQLDSVFWLLLLLSIALFLFISYLLWADSRQLPKSKPGRFLRTIYELALLDEENAVIRTWRIQGMPSVVIGKSTLNIHADVDLRETAFATLIDPEHALLNYTEKGWFLEDNDSRNGLSVVKRGGKRYFLSKTEPCLIEKDDIIYIANTRLLVR